MGENVQFPGGQSTSFISFSFNVVHGPTTEKCREEWFIFLNLFFKIISDPKPFLELSFVMNQSEHSKIVEIKLLEALVQEFSIQLDQSLINEILDLIPKESIEIEYNVK